MQQPGHHNDYDDDAVAFADADADADDDDDYDDDYGDDYDDADFFKIYLASNLVKTPHIDLI